jgi:cation diffusion facilitator CzcD-associated flavoprotein CzcO
VLPPSGHHVHRSTQDLENDVGVQADDLVTAEGAVGAVPGHEAYLGTTVAGFPNFFVMAGPNTGLGHNSQIFMIEAQARYIVDCLRRLRRRGAASIEVRAEVQREFAGWLQGRLAATVWQSGGCRSWYQDAKTGRNTILWPDTTIAFWRRTRHVRAREYRIAE